MLTIVSYASKNPARQEELRTGVKEVLGERLYQLLFPKDETAAIDAVREAEIIFAWILTEPLANAATKLKWLHVGYAGVDKSLWPPLFERNVIVTNARGVHGQYMAEWTLGALYYLTHRFAEAEAWRRDRRWKEHKDVLIRERSLLQNRRALIVGYGSVGKAMASKLRAVDIACEAIAAHQQETEIPLHKPDELASIIGRFDIVILALPGTRETRGLFDRDMLQRLKPGSILVNFARGWIVEEAALIEALQHGPLAAAALDVFAAEPLPDDHLFYSLPNVFMTPHTSGNFPEYTRDVQKQFLRNLARYLKGEPLENVVDKVRGY